MRHVGVVLFPGFQILDLVVVSAFELANEIAPRPIYDIRLYSEEGGGVTSSSGVRVDTVAFDDAAFDTVMVTGTMNIAPSSPKLLGFLTVASTASRRIASICTGAYILAEAGLLDDRRATTHWAFARRLQEQFPKIKVMEDKIFIVDGKVWSSAGM